MTTDTRTTTPYLIHLVLALMLSALPAMGQTSKGEAVIDSLKTALAHQTDEEKTQTLSELFRQYYLTLQVDSAFNALDQLIQLHQKRGDVDGEGAARWNIIALLNNAGKHQQLLEQAEEQMEWYKQHKMWDRFYQCWQRTCSANHDMGRIQTALVEAENMLDYATKHDNNFGRAMAYKQMGITYYDINQFSESAKALEQSVILLREEADMTGMRSGVYEVLCQSYDRLQRYEEAYKLTFEWEEYLHSLEKKHTISIISPTLVSCYVARTKAHMRLGRFDEAHKTLEQAIKYQEMGKSTLTLFYIHEMNGLLALEEGFVGQSIAYTDSALALGIYVDESIYELRGKALFKAGRGLESAETYRRLYERKDSIFNRDMRTQLDELNTIFKVDELQRKQQRTIMYSVIIIGSLVLIALLLFLAYRWREEKVLKQKNNELMEANARAEESLKIRSEFIKTISHEIRTPLNVLSGFAQIITSPDMSLTKEETSNIHQLISDNTKRIVGLVSKMLELSEASSQAVINRSDTISPHAIAEQCINHSAITTYSPAVKFTLLEELTTNELNVKTNLQAATRALGQLLDNAKKFTKEGEITLRITNDAHTLHFIVEDTGIGIPTNESERIFEEFTQLDKYTEGTGIGLSVARNLVRRLGGDIMLDTAYTQGARFDMTLPID